MSRKFNFAVAVLGFAAVVILIHGRASAQESGIQALEEAHEQASEGPDDDPDAGTPEGAALPPQGQPTTAPAPTATTEAPVPPTRAGDAEPGGRHTYDMPANPDEYSATGSVSRTKETERIGDYNQPRWTAFRRFPTTRTYVRPAGTLATEWWLESKLNLKDTDQVRHRSQYEFEYGLGHRLQFDVYLTTEQKGHDGPFVLKSEKLEVRYALADWGVLPLNPTLYAELVRNHDAPPVVEFKALFAEQLGSSFFVASNLVWEHELGDAQVNEYAVTLAAALSIVDSRLSLGGELKLEMVDTAGARFAFDNYEVLAGPSIWWSPVDPMRIMGVALLGFETEGPPSKRVGIFEPTVIVGWEI